MSDDLQVDPLEVRMAADHIDVAAEGLRTAHGSANERMSTAQSGWIGSSAAALSKVSAKWEQDSTAHYTALAGHVEGLTSAAARYVATDHQSSADIDQAASNLGTLGL